MRNIDVDVFESGIESVLAVVADQLRVPVSLAGGVAIVGAVEGGEVVSPVDVISLDGIGQALGVEDELIQFKTVGVDVVGLGRVAVGGGAEVEGRIEPSVNFCAAFGAVDSGHERVAVAVGLSDDGRAAVGPVGVGEWWRVEWGWEAAAGGRRGGGGTRRGRPVLVVEISPAGEETLCLECGWLWSVGERRGFIRLLCVTESA